MAKYRKKPVVIEAFQWRSELGAVGPVMQRFDGTCYVETLEGPLNVSDRDWIITGIKGEHYPCKPDVFEATYDPAEPQQHPPATYTEGSRGPNFPKRRRFDALAEPQAEPSELERSSDGLMGGECDGC